MVKDKLIVYSNGHYNYILSIDNVHDENTMKYWYCWP